MHYHGKSAAARRRFLRQFGAGLLTVPLLTGSRAQAQTLAGPIRRPAATDRIGLACIGMGIQGFNDVNAALKNPGIELVAVADLYDGRLARAKEVYGDRVFTTRDYREILGRRGVDAVIVATPDFWHDTITIDALAAGKHVYCEKPLVQSLDEGQAILEAEKRSSGVLIVGSQGVSSILTEKARDLFRNGELGQLVLAESFNDRFSHRGAWQYSIPTDASPTTVDWDTFLKDTADRPFSADRFFRWRNYEAYGTGVGGDLFVHLFSETHRMLDSLGPARIYATGGLRYWRDGRNVPDVFLANADYGRQDTHPAFNMQLRVNFVAGGGEGNQTRLVGSAGSLDLGWNSLTLRRRELPAQPGYGGWDSFGTFTTAQQKEFEAWYRANHPAPNPEVEGPTEWTYRTPEGYSDHVHHFSNWFTAIRENGKVVEDGAFGFRAAAPSLAANESYASGQAVNWDPVSMRRG